MTPLHPALQRLGAFSNLEPLCFLLIFLRLRGGERRCGLIEFFRVGGEERRVGHCRLQLGNGGGQLFDLAGQSVERVLIAKSQAGGAVCRFCATFNGIGTFC